MSYCVQCGVRLEEDLDRCPLCKTPVINPNVPANAQRERTQPEHIEQAISRIDRGYVLRLSIILTLIPMLAVLLMDIIDGGYTWSPYVIGALALLWCALAVPLAFRLKRPYLYVALDVLALCGYLALIAAMSGDFTWYLGIVLPLLVLIGAATLLMMLIIRRREMLKLYRAALSLVLLAAFIVGLEAIIDLSLWQQVALGWSVYTGIPLVILALMAAALQHNKAVKEAIRKRLFL